MSEKRCGLGYNEQQLLEFLDGYKIALAQAKESVRVHETINIPDIERRLLEVRRVDVQHKTLEQQLHCISVFGYPVDQYNLVNNSYYAHKSVKG